MGELPTGTVTFLFTDIEGSTRLLQALGPETYRCTQDRQAEILRQAITGGGGTEVGTEGDAFFAVFPTATGALAAAVAAQRELAAASWPLGFPLRVRMGLHTGEGRRGGDSYLGIDVNRAARIAAAGHGGQVLVSDTTRGLVEHDLPEGVALRDLGRHRLKDIEHPEHLNDLTIGGLPADFPPLRSLRWLRTNLPAQRSSFVGRERELAELRELLTRARLLTLTGAGGAGKTRLALRVAAGQLDRFDDGVLLVDLSTVTDPAVVASTIAAAVGVRKDPTEDPLDTLARHLADRELLLVVDNLEQVLDAARALGRLLDAAPRLSILATSRVPLHLSGEQEYPVEPLSLPDPAGDRDMDALMLSESVLLFVERARAVAPRFLLDRDNAAEVAEIVRRVDGLLWPSSWPQVTSSCSVPTRFCAGSNGACRC
jgi:class 3 adenylate cyclase